MSKILIIDDSPTVLKVMSTSLMARGLIVQTAQNGLGGLEVARQEKPSAIVLDIHLPDIDGLELLDKLKEDEELKDIPVILLTGHDEFEHVQRAMTHGAVAFMPKYSTTPKLLYDKLKQLLGL